MMKWLTLSKIKAHTGSHSPNVADAGGLALSVPWQGHDADASDEPHVCAAAEAVHAAGFTELRTIK